RSRERDPSPSTRHGSRAGQPAAERRARAPVRREWSAPPRRRLVRARLCRGWTRPRLSRGPGRRRAMPRRPVRARLDRGWIGSPRRRVVPRGRHGRVSRRRPPVVSCCLDRAAPVSRLRSRPAPVSLGVLRRVYTRRIKYVAMTPTPQHPHRNTGGSMTVTDERIPAQWARGAVLLGAATTRETQTANGEMPQGKAVTPIVAPDVAPVVTPTIAEPVTPTVTPAVADSAGDVAESVTPERDAEPRNAEPQKPVLRGLGAIIYARAQAREMRRNGRAERRNRARITRAEAKAIRCAGSAGTATRGGILGWLRDLPTHTLGIGVTVGWLMALAGSAVGQLAWWSSEFPWWIACLFALTF